MFSIDIDEVKATGSTQCTGITATKGRKEERERAEAYRLENIL